MIVIGHRGARGLAPENTIAALQKGLAHNVDMLEFDLRVTKDDVVVLHHDAMLTDPSGNKLKIAETPFDELKAHKPDLATFDEMLDAINSHVPLYTEVKRNVPVKPIIAAIRKRLDSGWRNEAFLLGSKSQETLRTLHAALPQLATIVIEPWSGVRAHRRARQVNAKIISMNQHWLWWGFIRGFKNSDTQLFAYTLNDPKKAKRWAKWGLSGVVTDYPDRYEK